VREMTALVDGSLIRKMKWFLKETTELFAKEKCKKDKNSLLLPLKWRLFEKAWTIWKTHQMAKCLPFILKHLIPTFTATNKIQKKYSNCCCCCCCFFFFS
jgi:hypothetical protein